MTAKRQFEGRFGAVAIYCGSRTGHHPSHGLLAEQVGALLAGAGVTIVYGGGSVGLMGLTARAALAAGGRVVGVIPHFLDALEVGQPGLSEMIRVETMHERKWLMLQRADAVLALPGSIGTLDELLEVITWRELGLHDKPIFLLGPDGYWAPFVALLRHIDAHGFAPPDLFSLFTPLPDLAALRHGFGLPPDAG